jgi:hypothetical protein
MATQKTNKNKKVTAKKAVKKAVKESDSQKSDCKKGY